ncbi:MAG: hypothetical protein Alis3KO_10930 [Aliiglaciecola sp.]
MANLTELSQEKHKHLGVLPEKSVEHASKQHLINIRVTEVPRAVSSFPVFYTRKTNSRDWAISALANIKPGESLFVKDGVWDALYQPSVIRTYPLYLMQTNDERKYTIGIIEESDAFSKSAGEALFDEAGRPSLMLNEMQKLLENSIKEDIQTFQFTQKLDTLGLLKPVDILVHFQDGSAQTLTGMSTINEDRLLSLNGEQLEELNQLGYLTPIQASLISIYQIHELVRRNNAQDGNDKIDNIRLEIARERPLV